ncbi:hypothetical protein [Burkholderia savannae]|uniref:hypothetical protein n=1 Tax=Burkholderia savannae TaxID=1637837 RepID=UPI0012F49CBA|nr:hypothetical protein [Burkholderia savannae]
MDNPLTCRPADLPTCRPADLLTRRSADPPIHRSIDPSIHRSIDPSIHRSIDPSKVSTLLPRLLLANRPHLPPEGPRRHSGRTEQSSRSSRPASAINPMHEFSSCLP